MKLIWLKRNEKHGDTQPNIEKGNEKAKADYFRRTCDEFKVTECSSLAEEMQGRRMEQTQAGYLEGMKFSKRRGYRLLELEVSL